MQAFERFGTDVKVKLEPENSNQENSFKIYLIEGSKRLQKGAKEAAERGQRGRRKGPERPQKGAKEAAKDSRKGIQRLWKAPRAQRRVQRALEAAEEGRDRASVACLSKSKISQACILVSNGIVSLTRHK